MRILIITAELPYPPASGGAIRAYGIIRGLHEAGHVITLVCLANDPSPSDINHLSRYCSQIRTLPLPQRSQLSRARDLLLSSNADIAKRMQNRSNEKHLLDLIQENEFDLIQFEGIEVACYLPSIRAIAPDSKICFDTFNAEAQLQYAIYKTDSGELRRWPAAIYSRIQSKRIERYERDLVRQADIVLAVSEEDARILRQYRKDQSVARIIPNGINIERYQHAEKTATLGECAIVFTGKMDYRPNIDAMLWFTGSIFDKITQEIPSARLYIVGQKPHNRLQFLQNRENIIITGWVDSVLPYLRAADVYAAPLRMGSGTRLKILEAMASGCAIVATSIAASGLSLETKRAMIIADHDTEIAAKIIELLRNHKLRAEIGAEARRVVAQQYDWSVLMPRLLNVYREAGLG